MQYYKPLGVSMVKNEKKKKRLCLGSGRLGISKEYLYPHSISWEESTVLNIFMQSNQISKHGNLTKQRGLKTNVGTKVQLISSLFSPWKGHVTR